MQVSTLCCKIVISQIKCQLKNSRPFVLKCPFVHIRLLVRIAHFNTNFCEKLQVKCCFISISKNVTHCNTTIYLLYNICYNTSK